MQPAQEAYKSEFNGKEYKGKLSGYVRKTFEALNKLSSAKTSGKIIKELIDSKYDIQILHYRKNHRKMASIPTNPSDAHTAQMTIEHKPLPSNLLNPDGNPIHYPN